MDRESFNRKTIKINNVAEVKNPAVDIWEERASSRGKNKCKVLAMGAVLASSRKSKKASMVALRVR